MRLIKGELNGLLLIEPDIFSDNRGYFTETWSRQVFDNAGLDYDFVQANQSFSKRRGILRGIHFQRGEKAQAKLVRCVSGAVLDVSVDLRMHSSTYGKWQAVELSADNHRELLIPRGFGHGMISLTDDVTFLYLVDNPYAPEADGGILWNDPDLNIDWGTREPILSGKDSKQPLLKDAVTGFEDWNA